MYGKVILSLFAMAIVYESILFISFDSPHGCPYPSGPFLQVKKFEGQATINYQYLLSVPPCYSEHQNKNWPLLIFLHGRGEVGGDIERIKKHGVPRLIQVYDDVNKGQAKSEDLLDENVKKERNTNTSNDKPQSSVIPKKPVDYETAKFLAENFITISIHAKDQVAGVQQFYDPESIMAVIEDVKAKYKVDSKRIYLTGASMGGYGTMKTAIQYPHFFAAIVPVCGYEPQNKAVEMKETPIWLFHGAKDNIIGLDRSQKVYDEVMKAGGEVKITIYDDADHDSFTDTYNNVEMYHWLLEHKRRST